MFTKSGSSRGVIRRLFKQSVQSFAVVLQDPVSDAPQKWVLMRLDLTHRAHRWISIKPVWYSSASITCFIIVKHKQLNLTYQFQNSTIRSTVAPAYLVPKHVSGGSF